MNPSEPAPAPFDSRPNPEALLNAIQRDEASKHRGQLKVFLGMCPGVGKTFAMLESAHRELKNGRNLLVAYLETHGRPETDALANGLPQLPRKTYLHRGVQLAELDLDAVLAQKPDIVLVDELAHTNAPGCRHPKRWQDVMELLDAGIHVYTTLNVQHVESRSDTVRQITGIPIRETVPDSVLDHATLELVDLPPSDLLLRLQQGKVYLPDRAATASSHFFQESHLTALRELALRLVADHVGADTHNFLASTPHRSPWKTRHLLLVGVGPSPSSDSLLRWTRRMADGLQCPWLAVHVEHPHPLPSNAQQQLEKNLRTARELGAQVIATTDTDLVRGLLRVAHQNRASQIIVGKPAGRGWLEWIRGDLLIRRLSRESGDIDLQVVRAQKSESPQPQLKPSPRLFPSITSPASQYALAVATVLLTSLLNGALSLISGPRVPGLIFLLSVVLIALKIGRGPVWLAGILSALAWNFFFLPPRFTLAISEPEDAVLFGLYFVVASVLGQLVARIRTQERAERSREEHAIALYEFTRDMSEATSRDQVVWQLIAQIQRAFHAPVGVALATHSTLSPHPDSSWPLSEKELAVAQWSFQQRKPAGRFTDNLPGAEAFHLPLATERKCFGVLALKSPDHHLSLAQHDLLDTFARQAAVILDRIELRTAAEQARLLAESEKFSRTLLNSISHELRTPLAASTSAASSLLNSPPSHPDHQRKLIEEILEANSRLNRIVGNLLDVARLESGKVRPRLDWHDARDLVQTTLRELQRELASHPISWHPPRQPILIRIDFSLMQHALGNILINAATHTPANTPIEITLRQNKNSLSLAVADRGPGIPQELLPRIFEKFTRAPRSPAGGSGLGLTIAKGFLEAHGGSATAENRTDGGALFTLNLPNQDSPPSSLSHESSP